MGNDFTYLSAIEASFRSRGFPLEIMHVRQMSEHQNQTFWYSENELPIGVFVFLEALRLFLLKCRYELVI